MATNMDPDEMLAIQANGFIKMARILKQNNIPHLDPDGIKQFGVLIIEKLKERNASPPIAE